MMHQSIAPLSLHLRCSGLIEAVRPYRAEHCWLILSIKQQERKKFRHLKLLRIRIIVSYSQHTACLQVNCTCCRNHVVPIFYKVFSFKLKVDLIKELLNFFATNVNCYSVFLIKILILLPTSFQFKPSPFSNYLF